MTLSVAKLIASSSLSGALCLGKLLAIECTKRAVAEYIDVEDATATPGLDSLDRRTRMNRRELEPVLLEENYAVRIPNPTRAPSPRQLPTNHVPAVSTRAYQCDQPSRLLLGCSLLCFPRDHIFKSPPTPALRCAGLRSGSGGSDVTSLLTGRSISVFRGLFDMVDDEQLLGCLYRL